MEPLKMAPPWVTLCNEIEALFGKDEDIEVKFREDDENYTITLMVTNEEKANAIDKIIAHDIRFGNVDVKIVVKYSEKNELSLDDRLDIFRTAFKDNPAVKEIIEVYNPVLGASGFVMFKKEVVQFFNDNMGDPNGVISALYADLANDVMADHLGIFFSTSTD